MKKGWDIDYLKQKEEKFKEELINETNDKARKDLLEKIELCNLLELELLFSKGTSIITKVSARDFLDTINGETLEYKYSLNEERILSKYGLKFLKLKKIKIKKYKEHFSIDDSLQIVGDFILDRFGKKYYETFYKTFIENNEYVLFNQNIDISSVTNFDNELFIDIVESNDIEMLAAIAHESGHIYRILNNKTENLENYYCEYESFFYELNLLIWLIKNNIYKEESINYFLNLYQVQEQILYMRYIIQKYDFTNINSVIKLKYLINKLGLKRVLNVKDNGELYDTVITSLSTNIRQYFYSFKAVLDNLNKKNSLEIFEKLVTSLEDNNEEYIKNNILNGNKTEIQSYLNYRNKLYTLSKK